MLKDIFISQLVIFLKCPDNGLDLNVMLLPGSSIRNVSIYAGLKTSALWQQNQANLGESSADSLYSLLDSSFLLGEEFYFHLLLDVLVKVSKFPNIKLLNKHPNIPFT